VFQPLQIEGGLSLLKRKKGQLRRDAPASCDRMPGNVSLCRAITSSGEAKGDAMNGEPKKQEPEIMPPVPEVEPERNAPEIPPDKDAPEKKSPIRSEG
jgi:hypothetical protein